MVELRLMKILKLLHDFDFLIRGSWYQHLIAGLARFGQV